MGPPRRAGACTHPRDAGRSTRAGWLVARRSASSGHVPPPDGVGPLDDRAHDGSRSRRIPRIVIRLRSRSESAGRLEGAGRAPTGIPDRQATVGPRRSRFGAGPEPPRDDGARAARPHFFRARAGFPGVAASSRVGGEVVGGMGPPGRWTRSREEGPSPRTVRLVGVGRPEPRTSLPGGRRWRRPPRRSALVSRPIAPPPTGWSAGAAVPCFLQPDPGVQS
jgi:hypothetical protein